MRAAAIAHAYVKPNVVEPFRDARVNVFRGNTLEPNDLPDVAMVFGGDGAVHRVLPSLAYTRTPLLVVPTGSANDLARCLGIPTPDAALRAWRRYLDFGDNVRCIDLGTVRPMTAGEPGGEAGEAEELDSLTFADIEGQIAPPATPLGPLIMRQQRHHAEESAEQRRVIYFGGIAGVGLDGEANRRAARMPGWLRRHGGYGLAALWALMSFVPPTLRLYSYDGGEEVRLVGAALVAAIGNAPEYGHGMKMLPHAQLDDGRLDLCFVPAMSKARVLRYFHRIYWGGHIRVPEVQYFRTRQVFLESDTPLGVYGDGELLCQTPVEIAAAPRALRVIVP
ncbi:MAG: diacylglycerol kinase family protein [Candidatus Korobacteraceae bacterium]